MGRKKVVSAIFIIFFNRENTFLRLLKKNLYLFNRDGIGLRENKTFYWRTRDKLKTRKGVVSDWIKVKGLVSL